MDDFKLYGKLLDLNEMDAFGHWRDDALTAHIRVMGQYLTTMNIIAAINRAVN